MRDVARLARVSVATVSAVVNGKSVVSPRLVKRVQDAMKALDYHPDEIARSLKVRRTNTIGMVIPDLASGFFVEVFRGVEDAARAASYSVLLCNSNDDIGQEQRHLRALLSRRVDGILLASTEPNSAFRDHGRRNIPLVLFDRIPSGYTGPAVVVDNSEAAYSATQHLISIGHVRIAVIAGRQDLSTGIERTEGFRRALGDANLPLRAEYCKQGNFKADSGFRAGLELLKLPDPPTAILSENGMMTLGLLQAIRELGIHCPDDVSIIGFDELVPSVGGLSFGNLLDPQMTVIAQPAYEIGATAARELIEILQRTESDALPAGGLVKLKAELRIRNSVAKPRDVLVPATHA
jgi:LacI family transcriptional regulator